MRESTTGRSLGASQRCRAQLGRSLAVALALVLASGGGLANPVRSGGTAVLAWPDDVRGVVWPGSCTGISSSAARANELMANRYRLTPHPTVTLPANPRWSENPLYDANWQFQYHALRYVIDLFAAWKQTGSTSYRDRAVYLLRDWYTDNPRSHPPSAFSWNDHSTAFRAMVYSCAADLLGMSPWLRAALLLHGRTLADPRFYVWHGNHALNQSIGLLEVGRVLGRRDWKDLARDRITRLVSASVDSQGVTNEQSMGYQVYNYVAYARAIARLSAAGFSVGTAFDRVARMPAMIAAGSIPDGTLEMIGDTDIERTPRVAGTPSEFVATAGAVGTAPPRVSSYAAGYLFVHSGWGETRAFRDETVVTARWGSPPPYHGHADGTSITLASWGTRLIVDPGKYTYNANAWRRWFTGRTAHNVVTVDGLTWRRYATTLLGRTVNNAVVDLRLRATGYAGVTQVRRVTYSRGMDYVVVEDRLASLSRHTYRQLWHLAPGSRPIISGTAARTTRTSGNVLIRELTGNPSMRIVQGATSPIQGWFSRRYGTKTMAPVVMASRTGTSVRYLTLIVPAAGTPAATVSALRLTTGGYRMTVTIGSRSERVVADGSSISVTPLTSP